MHEGIRILAGIFTWSKLQCMKRISALCFITLVLPFTVISQTNGICPDSLQTTFINYSEYSFFIPGIDDDQTVSWDFGDGFTAVDDSLISHAFMAGTYLITAIFFDADCPWDGPSLLSTELVVEACGIEISYVETKTGLFTFTAVGIPEEYPMYWDMGDGTQIVETWVVDNFYDPGTYQICAWYYTELCPDTVEACVEMVYAPDTTCSAEFSYELIEDEELDGYYQTTALHAWNDSPEFTYIWDFGDGPTVGSADIMMNNESFWEGEEHGTQVCLTTIFGACSDTVCHRVMNCDYGHLTAETTGYGIESGEIVACNLNFSYYMSYFSYEFDLSSDDSVHQISHCPPFGQCSELFIDYFNDLDSIGIKLFHLQNVSPLIDTIYTDGYILAAPPGCIIFSVNEHEQSFSVFPSITNDDVEIVGPAEMKYALYDLNGRICSEGKVFSRGTVDVSELTPGIYLIRLQSGNLTFSSKIIRQP